MKTTEPDEILTILSADARTSVEKIATLTGRSVEEVKAAIATFERNGIIKRYTTSVDWEKAGVDRVHAFIDVKVQPARDVGFDAVAERIYRFPEVRSLWLVSGGNDLRVAVHAQDLQEMGRFVADAYGAHLVCDAPEHRLPAPTRKLMTVRFALAAAQRYGRLLDPQGHAEEF